MDNDHTPRTKESDMDDDYAARLKAERARRNAERDAKTAAKLAEIEAQGQESRARHEAAIADIKNRRAAQKEATAWERAQAEAIQRQRTIATPAVVSPVPVVAEQQVDDAVASKQQEKEARAAAKAERKAEKKAARSERKAERQAAFKAEMEAEQAEAARLRATYGRVHGSFTGKNGSVTLKDGYVKIGMGLVTKVPVDRAAVSFEGGGKTKRITATRVVTGGVLLGPLGAAAGAALRKDKAGAWIFVCDTRTGHVEQVPVMPKEVGQAIAFVASVESAQQLS
jgi:hypothetical protein